jgi:cyclopropane fatty-acyl-phospholipid synthase-like methyltransferase
MIVNKRPFERCDIDNPLIPEQTKRHHIERYNFAQIYVKAGDNILDLCCGTGYGLNILRSHYPLDTQGMGLDIDAGSISKAKTDYSFPKRDTLLKPNKFRQCDLTNFLSWRYTGMFNVITFFEAIEHFLYNDGLKILFQIKKLLKKNGTFILSSPKDINDKYNIYHKSIWAFPELKNVVGSIFGGIELWGQDWDTGIIDKELIMNNDIYVGLCKGL